MCAVMMVVVIVMVKKHDKSQSISCTIPIWQTSITESSCSLNITRYLDL